jgi:tetratricopeptide (TPR) repeat protein
MLGLLAIGAWLALQQGTHSQAAQLSQSVPLTARRTTSVRAYELYLQGIFERGRRDIIGNAKAIENFRAAIEADPHYAEAWSGLADALMASAIGQTLPTLPTLREADQAARRAVELNGSLAEARTSLGHVRLLLDHDFASAEAEFARALELNDRYARLWHLIGILRAYQGRGEEALAAMRRARELEPMTLLFNANYGLVLYHLRRYGEAIAHLEPLIASQPGLIQSRSVLLRAHVAKGNIPNARQQLELMEGSSSNISDAGLLYAHAGQRDAALAEVARLLKHREQGFAVGYELAIVYAALGELPKGCAELETALSDGSPFLGWLKLDPRLDPLRSQPCFAKVANKLFEEVGPY